MLLRVRTRGSTAVGCALRAAPRGALAAHPHSRKRTAQPRPAAPARTDAARARHHGLGDER
eukprot:5928662-Prymnesium_polylepis.1